MKTGPKPGEHGMTMAEIATVEGCSRSTIERVLRSAVRKLRRIPGSLEAILSVIHRVNAGDHPPLRARSVECRREWIERYGGWDV